jgi:NAD(P)-dependent dehydrogenase (short-subunit alcohol dehydrogenase family)
MRILVVGASGTIGRAVVTALQPRHEVSGVTRHSRPLSVDVTQRSSIEALFREAGPLDAVVATVGEARFAPLPELDDAAFAFSLENKLMGQVNLVRVGLARVRDGGVFVLTSGVLSRAPTKGGAAFSLVNAGLEGFARAAALEAPRGIRVNVVSPPWVTDTLRALGMDPSQGKTPEAVARAYVQAVEGDANGAVLEP